MVAQDLKADLTAPMLWPTGRVWLDQQCTGRAGLPQPAARGVDRRHPEGQGEIPEARRQFAVDIDRTGSRDGSSNEFALEDLGEPQRYKHSATHSSWRSGLGMAGDPCSLPRWVRHFTG